MKPISRPKVSLEQCEALFERLGFKDPVCVFGIRGYFQDTMGKVGENDRGMYDDAIGVYAPGVFVMFNGNVDPSRYRKGKGKGALKGMASLKTGVWHVHQLGLHKGQYTALVQTGGKVTVIRDGNPPYEDTGYFGINIHKGSITTTSSEGCQTLPPDQWLAFIELVKKVVKDNKLKIVPYVLMNEDELAPKVLPPT